MLILVQFLSLVYLDQLLGAARTRKLVEILFFTEKGLKWTKKFETAQKVFQPAFRCAQLVKIHNIWGPCSFPLIYLKSYLSYSAQEI